MASEDLPVSIESLQNWGICDDFK